MDGKYLDKQKVLDWLDERIFENEKGEKEYAKSNAYNLAYACQNHKFEASTIKNALAGNTFDATLPEEPGQAEVRVGDVRVSHGLICTVTNVGNMSLRDDVCIVWGDGSTGKRSSETICDEFALLHHADTWQDAIAWMTEHKGGEE